jgi:4-hydroxy-3-methylbut-2-enyl diphosphate reductase
MWRSLRSPDPDQLAYVTQTTLSVDDTRVIIEALRARFPDHRRAGHQGYLLRHPEPPARGAGTGQGGEVLLVVGARNSAPISRSSISRA